MRMPQGRRAARWKAKSSRVLPQNPGLARESQVPGAIHNRKGRRRNLLAPKAETGPRFEWRIAKRGALGQ
jgi:hypothetical protein